MKVAYLLGSLNRGGTETLLLDIFKQGNDAGYDMIGVYRKKGRLMNDFLNTKRPLTQLTPRFFGDPLYYYRLRKHLIKNKVSIVHAQQAIDAFYAWIACKGTGIKLVLTLHGYNFKNKKTLDLITRFIINKTDLNIYVSRSQMNAYKQEYNIRNKTKQVVVYNGISFQRLDDKLNSSLREEFNIPGNSLLLGSVGNFVKVRDQMTICRFLNLLNKSENSNFAFIFAGAKDINQPELYENCVRYCEENGLSRKVFFPGSRSDIPSILNQLDAFIYASNHDTFGIAVIEAMAAGLPVFVNDWEVMMEITDNGKHGVAYKTKNEKDLLNKFEQAFLNIPKAKVSYGKDAEWAKRKFGISTTIRSLMDQYISLKD